MLVVAPARMSELRLANGKVSVTVLPGHGARIDQLRDETTGRDWLWHPEHYRRPEEASSTPIGAAFDERWSGGWDHIFPNDAAGTFRGRELADHGELWSQPWDVIERQSDGALLRYHCSTVPVVAEKTIRMLPTKPGFDLTYSFRNLSYEELPFLFKLHPAIAVEPGDRIELPQANVEPVDLGFSRRIGRADRTRFPFGTRADGLAVRLDEVLPADDSTREFFYCSVDEGWCAVRNVRSGKSLRIRFDRRHVPHVWVLQSFGGWGGRYVLLLEPSTNKPYDLGVALEHGQCAMLAPGGSRNYRFRVTID